MAAVRGQVLAWSVGGVQVEDQTDSEISFELEMDDFTSKDSTGNWKEFLPGLKSWSGSCSGTYDPTATEGADESIDDLIAGTALTVLFTTGTTGNRQWTGTAYITSANIQAPLTGPATYSISFQGTGVPTAADTA
ncbi:MAG: phage tail protein [bacterium]|nr:phage tail protein [bacterium]